MRRGAFFDVDETLISVKSMFSFLRFYLSVKGEHKSAYERVTVPLLSAADGGAPREEINRRYYALYAGESEDRLAEVGRLWYAEVSAEPGFFHDRVVEELHVQRGLGPVYLVSGSFFPCLEPLAVDLGAAAAIGTRPLARHGRLSGEVVAPLIGTAKAAAVSTVCAAVGLALPACSAYGDHASDLPMLELVGDPVVVGADPLLQDRAARHGWRTLELPARQDVGVRQASGTPR